MLRPTFKQADIKKYLEKQFLIIEREIITRLQRLGEECVNNSRLAIDLNAAAFPVSYKGKSGKPLKQRKITAQDRARNPGVTQPKFGSYLDYTGNLRASIGYAVIKDGQIVSPHYGTAQSGTSASIAQKAAGNARKGYGLVVIAGEDYALYVESLGYDVLSSAELFAKSEMKKFNSKLKQRLKQG